MPRSDLGARPPLPLGRGHGGRGGAPSRLGRHLRRQRDGDAHRLHPPPGGAGARPPRPTATTSTATPCARRRAAYHLFHGVDRPSLEWSAHRAETLRSPTSPLMASWKANVVRVALDQDFWLSGSPHFSSGYSAAVDPQVQWAEAAGMDVILDPHWSDRATLGNYARPAAHGRRPLGHLLARGRRPLPAMGASSSSSTTSPTTCLGGLAVRRGGPRVTVAGMQQLYDAVRAAGAENLVIIGGLDSRTTSLVLQSRWRATTSSRPRTPTTHPSQRADHLRRRLGT